MTREIIPATEKEVKLIGDKIDAFNKSIMSPDMEENIIKKNYVIKDANQVIAGITAIIYHNSLYVDVLFIDEKHRGQDLGSKLLKKVETEAKTIGATLSHLDTFDFQAKDFYLKHGYEIFGILDGCPKAGHKRYYLKKNL
jgi:GNAT superfamily N-acetyltransferase